MNNDLEPACETLRFPRGVRFAREDELPRTNQAAAIQRITDARITTGFVSKVSADAGYTTYIEANIHADEVWKAFETLADRLLPAMAAPIVGWKDDEDPKLGPYTDKSAALSVLRAHRESLQHNGYIEFGIMFQSQGLTEEVFVKGCKYLQIWTNRSDIAVATLLSLGVHQVSNLRFIDEFPRITEHLEGHPHASEVISAISSAFESLQPR